MLKKVTLLSLLLIAFVCPVLLAAAPSGGSPVSGGAVSGGGVPATSGGAPSGGEPAVSEPEAPVIVSGRVTPFAPGEVLVSGAYSVYRAIDADTLVITAAPDLWRSVRVVGIDSPERGDPEYLPGRAFAEALVKGETVTLEVTGTERFNRALAKVTLPDGRDYALLVLQAGLADTFMTDSPLYAAARDGAASVGKGMWQGRTFVDRNCSAFKTQPEAQAFYGGAWLPSNPDPHKLDGTPKDGCACSSLRAR